MRRLLRDRAGQSTVEFAVAFPVLVIVGVIAMNALLFFGDCAAFDRESRQAVRAVAASPGYGQGVSQSAAQVQSLLEEAFDRGNVSTQVEASGVQAGLVRFTATLEFSPTLFGMGLKDHVFGVQLPKLRHSASLVVDPYKPGVVM